VQEEIRILEKHADVTIAEQTDENYLVSKARDADVIMVVYCKITKRLIETANRLKGIVRYGIGVDNIDLEAATAKNVPVANVPDYSVEAVADHAFAFILTLTRKILQADKFVRTGQYMPAWSSPPSTIRGVNLRGKTLGIIGLGKIGKSLAIKAKGFKMRVLAHDPYITHDAAEAIGVILASLEDLLKQSDFVSIHAPLLPSTRGMIDERKLRLMKKTAFLINVARGPIVDERALCRALGEGWIAGAGIDVFEQEPPSPKNPLFKFDNVVLTPHIAWYTDEALQTLEMSAVDEAIRMLRGQMPQNLVNKEVAGHLTK
jgi:D-3-phosphoglycerate dehydrogenase